MPDFNVYFKEQTKRGTVPLVMSVSADTKEQAKILAQAYRIADDKDFIVQGITESKLLAYMF